MTYYFKGCFDTQYRKVTLGKLKAFCRTDDLILERVTDTAMYFTETIWECDKYGKKGKQRLTQR